MKLAKLFATFFLGLYAVLPAHAADNAELKARRQRAAAEFSDGIVLLHARASLDLAADGFREDPLFYYFTGLENATGAILAIDGASRESWLFLPLAAPLAFFAGAPQILPGEESQRQLGIEHVVSINDLETVLTSITRKPAKIYYAKDNFYLPELPYKLDPLPSPDAPPWIRILQLHWPDITFLDARLRLMQLLAISSPSEMIDIRAAANATVKAVHAAMRAIQPNVSQRSVELAVVTACWNVGAHGVSFWPWAMAGLNSVFPAPFSSITRYDHLNASMQAGDLVRLDVGCEWNHYQGDLGRTVPVSGHYSAEQRETWNIFVAAYQAGAKALRSGATQDQIFDAWKNELQRRRSSAKTPLAREAIDSWSDRKNLRYWQVHTMSLDAGSIGPGLREGMVVDFEPIAAMGGQGYYLEDMYLITRDGAENLTPGVPYTAEEIEAAMKR